MGLRLGVVGACGRGGSFSAVCRALPGVEVTAVCDTNEADLPGAAQEYGAAAFTDLGAMLAASVVDAVVIATPMPCHAPQAVQALEAGVHVLSEVPAAVSLDECRALTLAAGRSQALYAMAENYLYSPQNVAIRAMVREGLFGQVYYAEGEYLHELKQLNEITPWRRRWQTGIDGNTYPTHSLGPILQWMPGDRVESVSCAGSGRRHRDPRGDAYENQASTVTLCRMRSGGLAKLRLDMLSDRPHAMTNYQLQGMDGAYESARSAGERDRVWLRSVCGAGDWKDLADVAPAHYPAGWLKAQEQASKSGHGGGDYYTLVDFVEAIRDGRPPEVGIHEAMDMTVPGLVSQASIGQGSAWLSVPDSRSWTGEGVATPQLRMRYPEWRLASPPEPSVPPGYILRQIRPGEEQAYGALMARAGFDHVSPDGAVNRVQGALPGGFFVIEHEPTGAIVATAFGSHAPTVSHPNGGALDWVAADPLHSGRGLGRAITAAVTRLLVQRGYRDIYLLTDDWRLPAIACYLQLGWEPIIDGPQMRERWGAVHASMRPRR
jgi:predicted dehydrogenase/GNAT superfamily N-acetyltransferase